MNKRITFMLIMTCIASIILFGCGGKEEKGNKLHVGYFNNITHSQALYMKAQGSLREALGQDTEIEWTSFNAGPAEIEALFSGDIDIGYIGPVPAIMANTRSEGDVTVRSGAANAGAVLVTAPDSGINTVEDLAGKIIAIPQIGNTQHLCLLKLMEDYGLKTVEEGGDVTVTAVENADVGIMMDQGNVDAALVPEPWGSVLQMQGAGMLLDYKEVYRKGDYPVTVVVVRNDYLKENPEIVEAFLAEHERVTGLVNEDPKGSAVIVNDEINEATGKSLDENILDESFQKIGFSTEVNKEAMEEFGTISLAKEFITQLPENLYVDMTLLKKE